METENPAPLPKPTFRLYEHYVFGGHRVELARGTRCRIGDLAQELSRTERAWPKAKLCLIYPDPSKPDTKAEATFLLVMDEPLAGVFVRDLKRRGYRVHKGKALKIMLDYTSSVIKRELP